MSKNNNLNKGQRAVAKEIKYNELIKDFRVTEDGRLFRLNRNRVREEKEVIIKNNTGNGDTGGYCTTKWKGTNYRSHRLMYCLYHQVDADVDLKIDHKDGNRLNNSKENLIFATVRANSQNLECHRNGKLLGCSLSKSGRWVSQIWTNDKLVGLGYYETEQEAHEAYLTACGMLDKSIEELQEHFGIRTKDKCTSKYVGVSFNKANGKWRADVITNGKRKYLGYFLTEEEAYQALCNY